MTPAQHLLSWLTPDRCKLLNGLAFDRNAHRPLRTFARFMKRERYVTLERIDLRPYYPCLHLVGYLPPVEVWQPPEPLTPAESSADLRVWFTDLRRQFISLAAVDELAGRPSGMLGRYLHREAHVTFKIVGLASYYRVLALVGFVPPS